MNIKPTALIKLATLLAITTIFSVSTHAQMTATWSGGGGDTDWNNTANWDIGTPAEGTNAVIGSGIVVDYNAPMAATSFAGVNNSGTLNINAAGFNIDAGGLAAYTGSGLPNFLRVNAGGVMIATNSGTINLASGVTNSVIDVEGGILIITNSTGNIAFGANGNNAGGAFTNNGGTVIFSQPFISKGRFSSVVLKGGSTTFSSSGTNGIFETSNDQERQFLINGGTVNLGNFVIGRALNTVGTAGLVISNGIVNATTLLVGNGIAAGGATIAGGILTNTGTFTIADRPNAATSSQRRVFFYVRGGSVYSTDPAGIIVANQANNSVTGGSSVWGGFLDINSGLVVAEKLTLVGPNAVTNAFATLTLAGTGALYLGSGGLVGNVGFSNTAYTVTLSGGTLGAKADYSINANGSLSGTFTVNAADLANAPHNITNLAVWSGSGSLVKMGGGTLVLKSNNTYSGTTLISQGTLALASTGSISNTSVISIESGAALDASALGGGFPLGAARTLQGYGTVLGNLTAASGSTISPGSNTITGTLTFAGSVTQSGGVVNKFDLSSNPSGPNNDFISIGGDFNVSGANTIQVSGGGAPGSVHPLIQYGGNFNGTIGNLTLVGASGVLSNDATTTKTIYLVIQSAVRPPTTNVVWQGNATVNDWDLLVHMNWLTNGVTTYFVSGDSVVFDATGAANPNVNIVGNVDPAAVLVNAAANYTFGGSGNISGSGTSLVKTNSGTLTILITNSYTGPTTIAGGALEVTTMANGGSISGIGASPSGSANLVLDTGTLRYLGAANANTDRGATLNSTGGTIGVTNSTSTLTFGGTVTGGGALTKTGPGILVLSAANNYLGGTTISNGVLQINNATGAGPGIITNDGGALRVNGALVVDNALQFDSSCRIELNGVGAGNIALRGAWSGSGNVDVNFISQNTNQTFTMGGEGAGGGTMWNYSGTINFGTNTGFARFNNNSSLNFGSSNATFNLGTSNLVLSQRNGNTINHLGGLAGGPNTRLSGSRSDTPGPETYVIGENNLSTTFDGMITNGFSGSSTVIIIKAGTGTLTLGGVNPYTGTTTISNGVLALSGVGSISNTPSISLPTNTVLDVSARTDGAITLNTGQTLQGSGTIRGSLIASSGSILNVGDDAGIPEMMTITNSLTLQSGCALNMDLDHYQFAAGLTNDTIRGLSGVTYGGTLNLNILSVETNSVFKLFSAVSYSGAFDSINPATPPLSGGPWIWDTSRLTVDGTLRITVPVPTLNGITISGTDIILSGTNGTPFSAFTILSSTNLTLPLNQWTQAGNGSFDGNGTFTITLPNAVTPTQPQQFYLFQQ